MWWFKLKVAIEGRYTLAEFKEVITKMTDNLEANGVKEVRFPRLYFNTYTNGRPFHLLDEDGNEVEEIVMDEVIDISDCAEFQPLDPAVNIRKKNRYYETALEKMRNKMNQDLDTKE